MEKYYFKTEGFNGSICTEPCHTRGNGIMIGSWACQSCDLCVECDNEDVEWITCKDINKALGQ